MQVTFLYKLTDGSCPKSYGTNVARLAGLPKALVHRASLMAATLEKRAGEAAATEGNATSLMPLVKEIKGALTETNGTARDAAINKLRAAVEQLLREDVR